MATEKQSKRERRAAHEYTKSLNKPGRVGTFAESEKDRREDERQERESKREAKPVATERQDVRLPGAALLITIGLFVLWLAASGNLKRIGQSWDFIRGNTNKLPTDTGKNLAGGITDFSNYHVETHLIQPMISGTNPGGLN